MSQFTEDQIADLKRRACDQIDEMAPALIDVSRRLWETPEIAFQEEG